MTEDSTRSTIGPRILIVDDDTDLLRSAARVLQAQGCQVSTAESGEEALPLLARDCYQLVIMDSGMAGTGDLELAKWLEVNRPDTAVLITTPAGLPVAQARAQHPSAISYMEKPIELPVLANFLERLFHSPRFTGRICDIDLFDYLQLVSHTRKTKTIRISNFQDVGWLFFDSGRIIHAECGELNGLEAFYRIVNWEGGTFVDVPFEPPSKRSVTESTSYLLMEAAKLRDERAMAHVEPQDGQTALIPLAPLPSTTEETERSPADSKTPEGPFARFRKLLDELSGLDRVRGAVILSREGLIVARGGSPPEGLEPLIFSLAEAFAHIGRALDLGIADAGLIMTRGGESILLEPIGPYLLGAWLDTDCDTQFLSAWVRERVSELG